MDNPERAHGEEAYDTAINALFELVKGNTATDTSINSVLASLFSEALTAPHQQILIDNLSTRYSYDIRGILSNPAAGEPNNEKKDIKHQKAHLVSSVTGLLVASEYSRLTNNQREALLPRAAAFIKGQGLQADEILQPDILQYVALDADRASVGDNPEERQKRAYFVLDIAIESTLFFAKKRRQLRRNFNRMSKRVGPS